MTKPRDVNVAFAGLGDGLLKPRAEVADIANGEEVADIANVPATASAFDIIVNLVTGGLGAGILSLPWTAAGASVLTGAAITGLVLVLNGWTIMILVEAAEKYQVFDLGGILRLIPGKIGPRVEMFCNALIWVTLFLCLIGYNIIVADSVTPVMAGTSGWLENRASWVLIGSVAVLPSCFLDQKYLSFGSMLCIMVNVYLIVLVAYEFIAASDTHPRVCYIGFSLGTVSMFSALMMASVIQMCVLPMYESLERRSIPRFRRILVVSFGFLFLLFVGFQTLALLVFGPEVKPNILDALPRNTAGNAARLGMVGVVLGVYPLMLFPMIAPLRGSQRFGGPMVANTATVVVVAAAMGVAFFYDNLGVMNVVNGAISVGGFVAIAPGLVGLYLVDRSRVSMGVLIVLGSMISVAGVMLPDNYVNSLMDGHCAV